jgi:hypothetical protein
VNLFFALCPEPGHGLTFFIEIFLPVGELLDNGFDARSESRPSEVLIDHSHLRVLAVARLAYRRDLDQGLAKCDREWNDTFRIQYPYTINVIKQINTFGQHTRNQESKISLGCPLILA